MTENIEQLRDELRTLDTTVSVKLHDLEQEYRSWQLGIPIPLGSEYVFAKAGGKWRFLHVNGTPVNDLRRDVRADFYLEWSMRFNFEMAAEVALRSAIESRKAILSGE